MDKNQKLQLWTSTVIAKEGEVKGCVQKPSIEFNGRPQKIISLQNSAGSVPIDQQLKDKSVADFDLYALDGTAGEILQKVIVTTASALVSMILEGTNVTPDQLEAETKSLIKSIAT